VRRKWPSAHSVGAWTRKERVNTEITEDTGRSERKGGNREQSDVGDWRRGIKRGASNGTEKARV
jgi:hypothetical protein